MHIFLSKFYSTPHIITLSASVYILLKPEIITDFHNYTTSEILIFTLTKTISNIEIQKLVFIPKSSEYFFF